jgi:hypothetical protein
MTGSTFSGLFICEGTSDLPLAELVESLFLDQGTQVYLSRPDLSLLGRVAKDVASQVSAGLTLLGGSVDVIVVHRDADNAGLPARRDEIHGAIRSLAIDSSIVPLIPMRMTEAWLLLDETAIRQVAGNPRGRTDLCLPKVHEVESVADPKHILQQCILKASETTGRRREVVYKRFGQHRRQLLERLDPTGSVTRLSSWNSMIANVRHVADQWRSEGRLS